MAQRRKKTSSKPRSQSPRQREETLRQLLTRERALRKQALAREKEARERELSTSDILQVISGSPTDVARVFDAIAERARVLCGASFAYTTRFDGQLLHLVGYRGASARAEAVMHEMFPRRPDPGSSSGRAILAGEPVQIPDVHLDPRYQLHVQAKAAEYRSMLAVPMLRGGEPIGAVGVARKEPGAFSDRLVSLLKIFADQAVIAIENARLFNETKEALEQQTASSEILRVISSSPTDLAPVFDAILASATRLCDAHLGVLNLYDGDRFRTVAQQGGTPEFAKWALARGAWKPSPATTLGRMTVTPEPVQVADIKEAPAYRARVETAVNFVELGGARSLLSVPLLRNDELLGAISIYRAEVRLFTDKQIALLKTFADQAAIAIENVRLFNETKEALEQQIATSDILRVISQSPRDVQPAFDTIARAALKLCRAGSAYACTFDGELIHLVGFANVRPEGADQLRQVFPRRPSRETTLARAVLTRSVVEIPDVHEDPDYAIHAAARASDYRSVLAVPLLRGTLPIGAIAVARQQAGRFPDKQIALLQTFADQAVIAIENVRLFREIQEKSAQLEVANKHKSDFLANMSHELRTPLNAIIGFSEALMDRMFGDLNDKQLEYQKDIHESGKHLLSLINDILDLSKIEAGHMELELSNFHLPTAVSNAVILVRERAMRHGIALGMNIDQRLGDFQADERKVKQILLNLLSNAVKFTPDGGRVDVSAKLDTDKVEIAVKDTGVGIAPEDQSSLFEEFKQVGKDSSRKAEGTGLGLALTKRLVELHGGQILVDSAVGKGSTFRVLLPARF